MATREIITLPAPLLRDLLGLSADANAPKPASDYFDASFVEAMNAIDFEADIARARAFRA